MTRNKLKLINGERRCFYATFERYSYKAGYKGPEKTILLKDICDKKTGKKLTDHLWFNLTKGFESLGELEPGTLIYFEARVKAYKAGYRGHDWERQLDNPEREDYKLAWPTKITRKSG